MFTPGNLLSINTIERAKKRAKKRADKQIKNDMKIIDNTLINKVVEEAKASPRLRMN